jgi:hypothetical protein
VTAFLEPPRLAGVPAGEGPDISVVVPVTGIHDDPVALYELFAPELARIGRSCEFLFVMDSELREEAARVAELKSRCPNVSAWKIGRGFGEGIALTVGFRHARGRTVLTLNPYVQVEPSEVWRLLSALDDGADLAIARRSPRVDSGFSRLQSSVFHLAVCAMTGVRLHDISCGLRAMTSEVARSLRLYGDQHRFLPLLAVRDGFRVVEVPVRQSSRERRWRVFTPATYVTRLLDLLTVFFLTRFTKRPLRFFGSVGLAIGMAGFGICLYLSVIKFVWEVSLMQRPLLLLGVLLLVLGIQTGSIGLLGEMLIFTHGQQSQDYRAEEIVE